MCPITGGEDWNSEAHARAGAHAAARLAPRHQSPRHVREREREIGPAAGRPGSSSLPRLLPQVCVRAAGRCRGLTAVASARSTRREPSAADPFSFPRSPGNLSLDSPPLDGTNRPHSTGKCMHACVGARLHGASRGAWVGTFLSDASSDCGLIEIQGNVGLADGF